MTRRKTGPDTETVELVETRSGGLCEVCGYDRAEVIHHRLPRRMGGTRRPEVNRPSNLLHISDQCHTWIEHHERAAAQDMGLLLGDRDDPRRVQVLYREELRWLDDKGGFEPPEDHPLSCAVWRSDNNPCDCNALERR